jgi:hypothetical protein
VFVLQTRVPLAEPSRLKKRLAAKIGGPTSILLPAQKASAI